MGRAGWVALPGGSRPTRRDPPDRTERERERNENENENENENSRTPTGPQTNAPRDNITPCGSQPLTLKFIFFLGVVVVVCFFVCRCHFIFSGKHPHSFSKFIWREYTFRCNFRLLRIESSFSSYCFRTISRSTSTFRKSVMKALCLQDDIGNPAHDEDCSLAHLKSSSPPMISSICLFTIWIQWLCISPSLFEDQGSLNLCFPTYILKV